MTISFFTGFPFSQFSAHHTAMARFLLTRPSRNRIRGWFRGPVIAVCSSYVGNLARLHLLCRTLRQAKCCDPPLPFVITIAARMNLMMLTIRAVRAINIPPWIRIVWENHQVKRRMQMDGYKHLLKQACVSWNSRNTWIAPSDDDDVWCLDRMDYLRSCAGRAGSEIDVIHLCHQQASPEESQFLLGMRSSHRRQPFKSTNENRRGELWSLLIRASAWKNNLSTLRTLTDVSDVTVFAELKKKMQRVNEIYRCPRTGEMRTCYNYVFVEDNHQRDWGFVIGTNSLPTLIPEPITIETHVDVYGCTCHADWGYAATYGVTFKVLPYIDSHHWNPCEPCKTCGKWGIRIAHGEVVTNTSLQGVLYSQKATDDLNALFVVSEIPDSANPSPPPAHPCKASYFLDHGPLFELRNPQFQSLIASKDIRIRQYLRFIRETILRTRKGQT